MPCTSRAARLAARGSPALAVRRGFPPLHPFVGPSPPWENACRRDSRGLSPQTTALKRFLAPLPSQLSPPCGTAECRAGGWWPQSCDTIITAKTHLPNTPRGKKVCDGRSATFSQLNDAIASSFCFLRNRQLEPSGSRIRRSTCAALPIWSVGRCRSDAPLGGGRRSGPVRRSFFARGTTRNHPGRPQ